MKVLAVLSLVSVVVAGLLDKRACPANNCNRAVSGTRAGDASVAAHKTDCSSFMLTTVTPATYTTTITVEDLAETPVKRDFPLQIRQVTAVPTLVPAYATACAKPADYAAACSCWGITASVTTAPTPTFTMTVPVDSCDEL